MEKLAAAQVLRRTGWLSQTPVRFQEAVITRSELLRLARGAPAYQVGDEAGGLYGLVSGRLDVHLATPDGAPSLTHVGWPGFWAGDIAAVSGQRRRMSIIAGTPSFVLRLSRAEMLRLVTEVAGDWLHFAELLTGNFITAVTLIDMLKRDDPVERIAALLLSLEGETHDGRRFVTLTQLELAALAHLGRNSISAALSRLEQLRLISRNYASVTLVDLPGLARVCGFVHDRD